MAKHEHVPVGVAPAWFGSGPAELADETGRPVFGVAIQTETNSASIIGFAEAENAIEFGEAIAAQGREAAEKNRLAALAPPRKLIVPGEPGTPDGPPVG